MTVSPFEDPLAPPEPTPPRSEGLSELLNHILTTLDVEGPMRFAVIQEVTDKIRAELDANGVYRAGRLFDRTGGADGVTVPMMNWIADNLAYAVAQAEASADNPQEFLATVREQFGQAPRQAPEPLSNQTMDPKSGGQEGVERFWGWVEDRLGQARNRLVEEVDRTIPGTERNWDIPIDTAEGVLGILDVLSQIHDFFPQLGSRAPEGQFRQRSQTLREQEEQRNVEEGLTPEGDPIPNYGKGDFEAENDPRLRGVRSQRDTRWIDATITDFDGVFQPVLDRTGNIIDPRFVMVPNMGVLRIEEYLTRWFSGDPAIVQHQQMLTAEQNAQLGEAMFSLMSDTTLEVDPVQLQRDQMQQQQLNANAQYVGFGYQDPRAGNPNFSPPDGQMSAADQAAANEVLGNEVFLEDGGMPPTEPVAPGGAGFSVNYPVSQLPEAVLDANGDPIRTSPQTQALLDSADMQRLAWGAMTPSTMSTWFNTADVRTQSQFQLLAGLMGLVDDPTALYTEMGTGRGPLTTQALESFASGMFSVRESMSMAGWVEQQLDAQFNNTLGDTMANRVGRAVEDLADEDIQRVITLRTTKPEDMEDTLREIVGQDFGMRNALSQDQVDMIVQGGLAREREAELQASAEYQMLIRNRDQAKRQRDLEEATLTAFLDATYTGYGTREQQYMGMTKGMWDSIATSMGADPDNLNSEQQDILAKIWAENIIRGAGGNINTAFSHVNTYAFQGRDAANTVEGGGLRSVGALPYRPQLDSLDTIEQMATFKDSLEAYTGLTYEQLLSGDIPDGGNSQPIVLDAPRFDMVQYLRRAAINTNPQAYAKQDMANKTRTWINDLIMAESPARR